MFVPYLRLENITLHIKYLANTLKLLITPKKDYLFQIRKTKIRLKRLAVLENQMALHILTATLGETCLIIKMSVVFVLLIILTAFQWPFKIFVSKNILHLLHKFFE